MKRTIIVMMIFVFAGMVLFAQSEEIATWSKLLLEAETLDDQLAYVTAVSSDSLEGAEEFYAQALRRLVHDYPSIHGVVNKTRADDMAHILLPLLGDAKYAPAAPDIWTVEVSFDNPLIKADALTALGKISDKDFLPGVIQILKDINARPQSDAMLTERYERIVGGAVSSLQSYEGLEDSERDLVYETLFFTNGGWYSAATRRKASAAMHAILEDPSGVFTHIIKSPALSGVPVGVPSLEIKLQALRACDASDSPPEGKAAVALAALTEGWKDIISRGDLHINNVRIALRKLALDMLKRYGVGEDGGIIEVFQYQPGEFYSDVAWPGVAQEDRDTSEELCEDLRNSFFRGDMDEKKAVIQVLGALGTKDAARLLLYFMEDVHRRRIRDGNVTSDEELARQLIPTLGKVGRPEGKPVLTLVEYSVRWTPPVRALAKNALQEINGASGE